MKRVGKKGVEWENAKKVLRPLFDKLGIYYCEFRGRHCTGEGTTFAHVLRRRHLGRYDAPERPFNLHNVCRLCINCADYLTLLGEEIEAVEIQRIIDSRNEVFMFEDL